MAFHGFGKLTALLDIPGHGLDDVFKRRILGLRANGLQRVFQGHADL